MRAFIDGNDGYYQHEGSDLPEWSIGMEEVEVRAPPPKTAEQQKADIIAQIANMERDEQLPRVTRESTMAFAVMLAASQGVSEADLYATNIAYKKIKDFDLSIASLRDQAAAL